MNSKVLSVINIRYEDIHIVKAIWEIILSKNLNFGFLLYILQFPKVTCLSEKNNGENFEKTFDFWKVCKKF